jgi:hypothetical protein
MAIALWLQGKDPTEYISPVYNELFKHPVFWFKNPTFWFHNAEGWRQKLNELTGIDMLNGSNGDQIISVLCYSHLSSNDWFCKKIAKGLLCKLGFFGNNMEHSFLRPRCLSIIFRSLNWKIFYWLLDIFEAICPIEKYPATTRTIQDYIFLVMCKMTYSETLWTKILKWKHRKTDFDAVFKTYFCQENNVIIYETFKKGGFNGFI